MTIEQEYPARTLEEQLDFARKATARQRRNAYQARRFLRQIRAAFKAGDVALARDLAESYEVEFRARLYLHESGFDAAQWVTVDDA